ncbi:MAG TPA: hypothetical protein VKX17_18805 [Planctomycetota bacterium]|nr:hypothetical protein [Planctomycetota bacterium]
MRTSACRVFLLSFAGFALLALAALPARAASSSWLPGVTGDWTDGSKWSGGVPGPGDTATIAQTNVGPTVSTHITCATVNMSNGSGLVISGGGTLTVTAAMNVNTINNASGPGTLEIQAGATLTTDNGANQTTAMNINLQNDGTVTCHTGFVQFTGGTSTGTFNATQPNTLILMPTAGGNTMIIKSGAMNGHFQVGAFGNSALQIDAANFSFAGTLELYDFLTGAGSLNIASGGIINIHGPGFTRVPGFTLPVTIAQGGTVHINSDALNSTLSVGANLTVNGTLQFDPNCKLSTTGSSVDVNLNVDQSLPGSITGTGKTTLAAGKTLTSTNTPSGTNQILGTFDNFGNVVVSAGALELGNTINETGATMTATAVGTEVRLAQGLFNFDYLGGTISGNLRIRNGAMHMLVPFNFTGNLTLDNGVLYGTQLVTLTNPVTVTSALSNFNDSYIQTPTTFAATSGIALNGQNLHFSTASFSFPCDVSVTNATLSIDSGNTLTFNKTLTLSNATLNGGGAFAIGSSATMSGDGNITGNLTNNGTLNVGSPTSTLTLNGAYTQAAGATLGMDIGGTAANSFDQFVINGAANLAGTLTVSLVNNFTPAVNNDFTLVKYFSHSGTWTTINVPPNGTATVNSTDVHVSFGPITPPPTITTLNPSTVEPGSGDLGLVVNGTGFQSNSFVKVNGTAVPTLFKSATELVAFVPGSNVASAGSVAIVVNNPLPGGGDSNSVSLTVSAGGGGSGPTLVDTDADGYPDEIELAVGSSPLSPASIPPGSTGPGVVATLPPNGLKVAITLNFAKTNSDSLKLSAKVPSAAGAALAGLMPIVDVGGAVFQLTLDDKGNSTNTGPAKLKFGKPNREGQSQCTLTVTKANLQSYFVDENLTNRNANKEALPINIVVVLQNNVFKATQTVTYSAKMGKTGAAK